MIRKSGRSDRRGFTLTEVLIALSITLLILLAMMQAFTVASKDIAQGRNRLILAERMQTASDLIRQDLEQLSLGIEPIVSVDQDLGYFEYVDGPFRDMTYSNSTNQNNSVLGDFDDVLAFTVHSTGEPFRGRYTMASGTSTVIESMDAEIIYFTQWTDPGVTPDVRRRDGTFLPGNGEIDYGDQIRLYRRVLLIRPDLEQIDIDNTMATSIGLYNTVANSFYNGDALDRMLNRSDYAKFLQFNDISLRFDGIRFVPNSLGTLSHPANRTAHNSTAFPHAMLVNDPRDIEASPQTPVGNLTYLSDLVLLGNQLGNDVLLENVVGFDVKVFDPMADVYEVALPITPDDPGFASIRSSFVAANPATPLDRGCFVDLGSMHYRETLFAPVAATPANNIPTVPLPTAVAVAGEVYQFAYWNSERDLSATPAAGYYNNLFNIYEAQSGGPTYTTWPDSFEYDAVDNDGDGQVDEGSDGIAIGTPVPDLFSDKDSAPPYAYPITSVQVTLRTASFDADRQKISASDQVIQSQVVVSTTNQ